MNFSVYLASRTEEENQILKRRLDTLRTEFRDLRFVGLHPQGLALSANENMAVVVINVNEWSNLEASHLKDLRREGYTGPVLVAAKPSASNSLRSLRAMDNVVFIEKPFEAKDAVGIVSKMLRARAVAQRIHRRFATDENAEVQFNGAHHPSRLTNLSKGGALLEFGSPAPVGMGDELRMKVELKDVSRVYTVPARVVWLGRFQVGRGMDVGVEFTGVPEVKKAMLGRF